MGGETQRDGGELSDTLPASACSAVSPETSKPQQLPLMSCTERYSVRWQRERSEPKPLTSKPSLGPSLPRALSSASSCWSHSQILRTDRQFMQTYCAWLRDQARKSLECSTSDLWPCRTNCASDRALPPFAWSAVIFIKQEADIETTSPIYSEAGILQTLYQQWVRETKELPFFSPTTNIELLKQNRIPENSPLTAWAQHSPVFKDFTNATNKCDF